jgi:integrase
MPKIKLTKKAIGKLRAPDPSGKQTLHWDTELRGFGVLCSGTTNSRTYVVQRDLPDGRTRRLTIAPVNVLDLDEARRRAEAALADLYRGADPKAARRGGTTLRSALDEYLAARKDLRAKSADDYRASVEKNLARWLDCPLREITSEMVEERHRVIASEVQERHRAAATNSAAQYIKKAAAAAARGWPEAATRYRAAAAAAAERRPPSGSATANGAMRALRVLWNFVAERVPDLPPNPVRRLRRQWFPVHRRERLVRADELPAFFNAVQALPNPVARDYLLLLLFTGLRRREAASLRWDDIDFADRVIRLPAVRTKAGRRLDLPMVDVVRDMLIARRALGKEAYVFAANSGAGHIVEPKFPLNLVAKATGIRVSAHDLRRTYITAAESADISPIALKALVNHSLGNDVTSGYIMMTPERLREPAQKVCDQLKKLCGVAPPAGENVARLTAAP